MSTLKSKIADLADAFAAGVIGAVRSASLAEILDGGGGMPGPLSAPKRGPGRPRKAAVAADDGGRAAPPTTQTLARRGKRERLTRRSASDIEHMIGLVVAKLGEHKMGLRSEQLQKALGIAKNEIVRPIEVALKAKRIVKTGEKRATVYVAK